MLFTTETGSTYEFNMDSPQVRRLGNDNGRPPTRSQGPDMAWRDLDALGKFVYEDGARCFIFCWADGASPTRTSPVWRADPIVFELLDRLPELAWPPLTERQHA
jgi:hypothetical protein